MFLRRTDIRFNVILQGIMEAEETTQGIPKGQVIYGAEGELIESSSHSFIVKIWLEETIQEAGKALWRGSITHVSRLKKYVEDEPIKVKSLEDIIIYIADYLEMMGVKVNFYWRLRRWLRR